MEGKFEFSFYLVSLNTEFTEEQDGQQNAVNLNKSNIKGQIGFKSKKNDGKEREVDKMENERLRME